MSDRHCHEGLCGTACRCGCLVCSPPTWMFDPRDAEIASLRSQLAALESQRTRGELLRVPPSYAEQLADLTADRDSWREQSSRLLADAAEWSERVTAAERLAHRLQHGNTIEGDDVCEWQLRATTARADGIRAAAEVCSKYAETFAVGCGTSEYASGYDDGRGDGAETCADRILSLLPEPAAPRCAKCRRKPAQVNDGARHMGDTVCCDCYEASDAADEPAAGGER
jgi:hypothetical protein